MTGDDLDQRFARVLQESAAAASAHARKLLGIRCDTYGTKGEMPPWLQTRDGWILHACVLCPCPGWYTDGEGFERYCQCAIGRAAWERDGVPIATAVRPRARLWCHFLDCEICSGEDNHPNNTPEHAESIFASKGRDYVSCAECSYTEPREASWCEHGRPPQR